MTIEKLDLEALKRVAEEATKVRNLRELAEFSERGTAALNAFGHERLFRLLRDLLPFTAAANPAVILALIAELEQPRAVSGGRSSSLNAFHAVNTARQQEAFAPAHSLMELSACVQEEVGELAGCLLGITGAKKRKAHKTKADALDGVADAITYLSLIAAQLGCDDLEKLLGDTFNMVSERAGSKLTTDLGQLDEHNAAGQVPVSAVGQESYWNIYTKSTGDAYRWTLHSGPFHIESEVDTEVSRLRSLRKGWEFERRMVRSASVATPPVVDTNQASHKRATSVAAPPAQPATLQPGERWHESQAYREQQMDKVVANIEKQVDPVRAAVAADYERAQRIKAQQPARPTAVEPGKLCECGHCEHAHELNHTSQRGPCEASAAANSYSLCRCLRFTEAMVCAESGDEP